MDGAQFPSLAQIRVLLVPVGTIRRSVFEKYAGLVRSIEQVRLGDILPDPREDKNRFLPSPLSTGYLHIYYTRHPPPAWHHSLSLIRLSLFPLAVIGIADCSRNDSISSLGAEFKATLSSIFSGSSATPFATKCFVFEDGDGIPDVNVGSSMPEAVMIPSLLSNKQVYIGTLLAEICHDILAEFPALVKAIDNPEGLHALSNHLFPSISKYVDGGGYFVHGPHQPPSDGSRHSAPSSVTARSSSHADMNGNLARSSTPGPTTNGAMIASTSGSLLSISSSKKRASSTGPSNGRLAKIVGDLYLLAGKLSDASYWYTEAISLFRTQQDSIWNASSLEGQCILEMLEAWALGDSLHTSLGGNTLADPWANISDKMGQAINLYSRASPMNVAPQGIPDPELASIVFLYTEAILRYGRMLFAVWSCKGWNPLSLSTMFSAKLPPSFAPDPPSAPTLFRLSSITNITRSQISAVVSQAHGPFLLHLEPSDRIQVLTSLAALYSCLGFKRKEVFILREVQAAVMDLVVCGREESRTVTPSPRPTSLNSESDGLSSAPQNALSIRHAESTEGNANIIRIARYIARVYGIDLCRVGLADSENRRLSAKSPDAAPTLPRLADGDARYGWPELQVGVVREALAMAEALPDHLAVAQFSLSTLRELRDYITAQEQQHLSASANRAISIGRRRGLFHSMQFWFDEPLMSVELSPIPFSRLPSEHQRSELEMRGTSAAIQTIRGPFIYDPRAQRSTSSVRLVQNESAEFLVTLKNPFMFDLEVSSVVLSTSGMQCHSQSLSATVPALSVHTLTLSVIPLEPGQLIVRGCQIQLPGGIPREFTFYLPSDSTNNRMSAPPLRISYSPYDAERIKFVGLGANHLLRPVSSDAPSGTSPSSQMKFLQYQVVPEQPLLRIRRSSIVQGTLMLYEGEISEIRLTLENISNIPVDFYKLSFDDSTTGPAQQLLADGKLSVAEAYETEYDLLYRPFFTWTAPKPLPAIASRNRIVVPVKCYGKVGCSQGTIRISYSYLNRGESHLQLNVTDTFHARQIVYPVKVTVYHTLQFSNLDIIPLYSAPFTSRASSHNLTKSFSDVQSDQGEYCLVSVDVSNIYGLPFSVTLERHQEGTPSASITRTVAPGCTNRLFLPVKRIMLPHSVSSSAIPILSDRQFVVGKDKLSQEAELLQRELFWYREKLVELLKAHWVEPGTGRTGFLSLRSQRFTLPMRNALRKEVFPIDVAFTPSSSSLDHSSNHSIAVRKGKEWHVRLREKVDMVVTVRNECASPKSLMMSVATVAPTPPGYALFDGKLTDNFLGTLPASSSDKSADTPKSQSLGVRFITKGIYDILVEVTEVNEDGNPLPFVEKDRTVLMVKVIVGKED